MNIKQIYFYLVSFISLIVLLVSTYSASTNILRYYVFDTYNAPGYAPPFYYSYDDPYTVTSEKETLEVIEKAQNSEQFSDTELQNIRDWVSQYGYWKAEQANTKRMLHDQLIQSFVAILISFPIFATHFRIALTKTKED